VPAKDATPPRPKVVTVAHSPMPYVAHAVVEASAPMLVGRTLVGAMQAPVLVKRKRQKRVCSLCLEFGTAEEAAAASQLGTIHYARFCPLFLAGGFRKPVYS
jgi:hypothetical protein